jgi:hypothetical protein
MISLKKQHLAANTQRHLMQWGMGGVVCALAQIVTAAERSSTQRK